ncbi:DEAD/DEAH box helicase [Xylanibacillus composti]|uniref:DEAD/DEAH box helicase n=1 Tax=Xylanibacillus composti TaxID=1572762 RepID=A0A8J4H3F9_9BACL|nr:DEAD/DEAH box helicase [Xylanibacillus composti]MDT9726024.1 DEAD/DEAH box helicase [Xylanibacillus composti]GIQ68831.1 DEAD/DEAH box helicase [Xylanibacillus composti]
MQETLFQWFADRFGKPTAMQREAWRAIERGSHTLIAAPTGSGKTLAAFFPCLKRIVEGKAKPDGRRGVRVLYVTPLKALNNDVYEHIVGFAAEWRSRLSPAVADQYAVHAAVRTGDTPQSTRASILRQPPDVLVTTPESLYLMLTSPKAREVLRTVHAVIVDEIHALAASSRGAHLSLSLERLAALAEQPLQRIGVSATQKPVDRVARFLSGWEQRGEPRPVEVVESREEKPLHVQVTVPDRTVPLGSGGRDAAWQPLLHVLAAQMEGARSVIVFVNSRRLAERLTLRLNDFFGGEIARSHHGSVSREKRLEAERLLREGNLRCIVATSSLELGIDIGYIDKVIQLDSPGEAAAGIQRIGRAGHAVQGESRGVIVARMPGQLAESAVLGRLIRGREIEDIHIPRQLPDVLCQQIIAMVAVESMPVDELIRRIDRSDSYTGMPREELERWLRLLSGYYPFVKPLLHWHREPGLLEPTAKTGPAAIMGAGTIPRSANYAVVHSESRQRIGDLDEEYVQESRPGDVFQLGAQAWMIRRMDPDRIWVTEVRNPYSEIPFWRSEAAGRSFKLGTRIGCFHEEFIARLKQDVKAAENWLAGEYSMEPQAAEQLTSLFVRQLDVCPVPTNERIVLEHFRDVDGKMHIVLHTVWGLRVNRAWMMAVEQLLKQVSSSGVYANAKNNGVEIVFPEWDSSWLSQLWKVNAGNAESLLREALAGSAMFAVAFRRMAETSLLLSRGYSRVPMWRQRLRSEELLKEALPYADDFPLLEEALRHCMLEWGDLPRLLEVLRRMEEGYLQVDVVETEMPSPFASQFLADYINTRIYEADAFGPELQAQLLHVQREAAAHWLGTDTWRNTVPAEALEEVRGHLEQEARAIDNEEAVYQLLKKRGDLSDRELLQAIRSSWRQTSPVEQQQESFPGEQDAPASFPDLAPDEGQVQEWVRQLKRQKRIMLQPYGQEQRWICCDEQHDYANLAASPRAQLLVLTRFMDHRLSFTKAEISRRYQLEPVLVEQWLAAQVEQGRVEAAPFADVEESTGEPDHWLSAKVASRLLRVSLHHIRRNTKPLPPEAWCAYLMHEHGLLPGRQAAGSAGLLQAIRRLQGLFFPLSQWESLIFPSRLRGYRKRDLDELCASGEIIWMGRKEPQAREGSIAFFLREDEELYRPFLRRNGETNQPELLQLLRTRGASFLTELARARGQAPSDTLSALMDLVWEGHVSNDQFAPLRLQSARRGSGFARAGSGQGRWFALLTKGDSESIADREQAAEPLSPAPPAQTSVAANSGKAATAANLTSASEWALHLLRQFGIVSREIASFAPYSWDSLQGIYRQLEEWGHAVRGFFIEGAESLQWMSKETAEQLGKRSPIVKTSHPDDDAVSLRMLVPLNRADQKDAEAEASARRKPTGEMWVLSAVDPVNPYGIWLPWPQKEGIAFSRKNGHYLLFRDGRWAIWIEQAGKKISHLEPWTGEQEEVRQFKQALQQMMHTRGMKKIRIETWNGVPAAECEAAEILQRQGAERDQSALVFWPSSF